MIGNGTRWQKFKCRWFDLHGEAIKMTEDLQDFFKFCPYCGAILHGED